MTQKVINIGKVLACAVLFLLLRFVAGFSYARSIDLGVLLALLLFWRVLKPPHFDPYWVRITPNWYQLLLDYGLIKDLEEWQRIAATLEHVAACDYNFLRDGIRFTALKPDLIYRNDRKEFSKYVDFSESIPEVSLLSQSGVFNHPIVSVGFALKSPPEGAYEIRITATDSINHEDCTEKGVAVALLPWTEFGFYREEFNFRRWGRLRAKRDKQMQQYGWARDETESDYGAPSSIEHKYFTVKHKRI